MGGAISEALRVATTRWRRRGRGKVTNREAELAVAGQQGRRDNQLAKKRRAGGEAYKRQKGGEASADKRRRSAKRMRGGGGTT